MQTAHLPPRRRLVVNIRGTNGSGKSHLVHKLLEEHELVALVNEKGKLAAYKLRMEPPIYIIGKYTTPNGGCDTFKGGAAEAEQYVEHLSNKGHVVFEGLLISGIAGRWIDLARRLPDSTFVFLELDTPVEKCIARVRDRRKARGDVRPFDPSNLIAKFKSVRGSRALLAKAGLDVRVIDHERAYDYVKELLGLNEGSRVPTCRWFR
jgi:hypothetical protein